jgi:Mg2+-importing ATPase
MTPRSSGESAHPPAAPPALPSSLDLARAATLDPVACLEELGVGEEGLTTTEARARLDAIGANVLRSHGTRPLAILVRQLRSYLLLLLVAAALVSAFLGERTDALIIIGILGLSVGLGFFNEYRSERAIEELHESIRRHALALRDGRLTRVDVVELVPGDIVALRVGDVVPADLRLLEAVDLECDESVLTGESAPVRKQVAAVRESDSPLDLPSCAFMGTVVRSGSGRGVVVATGSHTVFGRIALRLGERHEETSFQRGLRDYSRLLVVVTGLLAGSIVFLNSLLGRPLLESLLFALAIAVGLTPQLLPAIVTVSLATGSRRLAQRQVVVKRLVAIEDLGNIDLLLTDKTGTLTEGRTTFASSLDPLGAPNASVLALALAASEAVVEDGEVVGGNDLDRALQAAPPSSRAAPTGWRVVARVPFDHDRQIGSALVETPSGERMLVSKGAPEAILARCARVPEAASATLDRLFVDGWRVVAVATRPAEGFASVDAGDERDLELRGFLTFSDPPKAGAAESLARLRRLGVTVKIVTGDNGTVAEALCRRLGLEVAGTLTGRELEAMNDAELETALGRITIFARVTPEQKARIIRAHRDTGSDVGFLGDGVNDAIALHDADVGISVDTASEVAKDAADIVLLTKDLGILADGVVEGRHIFTNTIKYVLMGTSSNFGNMFSAAGASLWLSFLPMLPTQILLNNLLYDVSELTIPTDNVDEELVARPAQWDIGFIRRFMVVFGPISSLYDFLTFGVLLYAFHASETLFRTGWFVESLATQTLVIFVVRTRRVPFFRSRPSRPLIATTLACATLGAALPYSPAAGLLGFEPLPATLLGALAVMVATYLALVEVGKRAFFRAERRPAGPLALRRPPRERRLHRLAARWSSARRRPLAEI